MTGIIARVRHDKGFGFIKGDDGTDYFFHRSACERGLFQELTDGERVSFDETEGPKGPRAECVERA